MNIHYGAENVSLNNLDAIVCILEALQQGSMKSAKPGYIQTLLRNKRQNRYSITPYVDAFNFMLRCLKNFQNAPEYLVQ